jgi:malate permease and related proteins
MEIFIQVVLPVILIFLAGYGMQKWKKVDIKAVSTVGIYIMTPCLVFRTFYKAEMNHESMMMVVFSFILLYVILIMNKIYSRLRRFPQSVESGLVLSTAFMNSGNYGAPIILFAFGEKGFAYSVLFLVIQAIIMNFYGVYYAARGTAGFKLAIKSVLEMPPTYATILALVLNLANIKVPDNIFSAIDLVGAATIPTVMLILGMQLAEIKMKKLDLEKLSYGVIIRLFISPLIAFIITLFLDLNPLLEKVLIVSAAMPSAATTTLYAVQFDSEPELVSSITLVTTLISIVTITVLLYILGV